MVDTNTSILQDVKKAVGIHAEVDHFDTDLIMAINSAIFGLYQYGVGQRGFEVTGEAETWNELLGERKDLAASKSFIFVSVRLVFDRPETSYGIQALERMRDEWGWRLEVQRKEEA